MTYLEEIPIPILIKSGKNNYPRDTTTFHFRDNKSLA